MTDISKFVKENKGKIDVNWEKLIPMQYEHHKLYKHYLDNVIDFLKEKEFLSLKKGSCAAVI